MLSTQKIHHVLKKAGHRKALWEPSGNIRGWGEWREGYRIEKGEPTCVLHVTDKWAGNRMGGEALVAYKVERLKAYQRALEVAGIQSLLSDSGIPRLELHG